MKHHHCGEKVILNIIAPTGNNHYIAYVPRIVLFTIGRLNGAVS